MLRATALVSLLCLLTSCVSPHEDPKLRAIAMPSDFAIEFSVLGEPESEDAMRQSAQYVVESNRRLRVLAGRRAETRTFPRFLRDLTPIEFEALWAHVDETNLLSEPTSPLADARRERTDAGEPPPPPPPTATAPAPSEAEPESADEPEAPPMNPAVYRVAITARGRTHRYATTPAESPPTVSLLAMLAELRDTGSPMVIPPGALGPEPSVREGRR